MAITLKTITSSEMPENGHFNNVMSDKTVSLENAEIGIGDVYVRLLWKKVSAMREVFFCIALFLIHLQENLFIMIAIVKMPFCSLAAAVFENA